MKILLIGKTGQLGGSLLALKTSHQFIALGRSELDVESPESCAKTLTKYKPDIVINTAAFHSVPQCEVEPLRAFAVNCEAVRNLAALCKQNNVKFVTFSTDYVFGGEKRTPYNEDDRTQPLQMYGISRLTGELTAMATAPEHAFVIRTCGLYGLNGAASKGGNFVDKRVADAKTVTSLEMGSDQVVSPTFTGDLAMAVMKLIEHPKASAGIYHLINDGECNWAQFTQAIYELMKLNVNVTPVDRGGLSGQMRRPLYSALGNSKARALGIVLPHWRDALARYLAEKYPHNA